MALTFDSQNDSPHHHDERLQGICVDHSGQPPCGRKQESWRSPSLEGGGTGKQLQSSGRDCCPTSMSPALSQVGEVWDQEAGPAEPDYKLTQNRPCPGLWEEVALCLPLTALGSCWPLRCWHMSAWPSGQDPHPAGPGRIPAMVYSAVMVSMRMVDK